MHEPEIRPGVRVVAAPEALDTASWREGDLVMRIAPDEVLVLDTEAVQGLDDPHALVEVEGGVCVVEMTRSALEEWMEREAGWALPPGGGFAQGMAAGLPVKVWAQEDRGLLVTQASLAAELEARL